MRRRTTPALKSWLGASKVVHRGGRPRIMYHATSADFEIFDTSLGDLGAHFGSMEQANNIALHRLRCLDGVHIRPVYLRIENPLRLKDVGTFHADGIAPQLERLGLIAKGDGKRIVREVDADWNARKTYDPMLRNIIVRAGYDGVVYANTHDREGEGDCYIAFHSTQIKSAIGNSGAFDPHDPDITDSAGFTPEPSAATPRSTGNRRGMHLVSIEKNSNFQRWFADSQIIDKQGKPLVVFHGTDRNFTVFECGEEGFHFGSRSQARTMGREVRAFYLSAQNLFRIEDDLQNWSDIEQVADYLFDKGHITSTEWRIFPGLQAWLQEKGFDGYFYPNGYEGRGISYAVFEPTQIKSATHNAGMFDPINPDVTDGAGYAPAPESEKGMCL